MIQKSKTLLLCLGLLLAVFAKAGTETYSSRLAGPAQLSSGLTYDVSEGSYLYMTAVPGWGGQFSNHSVKAYLELGWDEALQTQQINPYNYSVTLNVTGISIAGVSTSLGQHELSISYNPASLVDKSIDIKAFENYHKLEVNIASITNQNGQNVAVPENMYLETRFVIERYYRFSQNSQVNQVTRAAANGELTISWPYLSGAESYELEWTYINNYPENVNAGGPAPAFRAASAINFNDRDFELNNTRVRTGFNQYRFPLVYDRGFILYRVRGVGRDKDNPSHIIYGKWSQATSVRNKVSHYQHYEITAGHESNKNWQYSANYAEEGKKKEVVSYFDGSLRNRQSITRLNTNNETIVGETVYDHQGRASIQTLPVPAGSSELRFFPNFNRVSVSQNPYSRSDFDLDINCVPGIIPSMDVSSGSSKYYSPQATATGTYQDLVPDAKGFPFTQTEYLPDNTGRVSRQSGVGPEHKLGSDHETKYFYGQPHQEELDRLFGYNAGYKTRYKKNMVIDPNGQVSVTYLDPQGRTIATALVGEKPDNLEIVADAFGNDAFPAVQNLWVNLLNKDAWNDVDSPQDDNNLFSSGNLGPYNDGLEASTFEHVVLEGSNYQFYYNLKAPPFQDDCESNIYYPIVYDINIQAQDKCGENVFDGGAVSETVGVAGVVGTNANLSYTPATSLNASNLAIGTYEVSKKLTVNAASVDFYADEYVTRGQASNCIRTEEDFYNTLLANSDTTCEVTCTSCLSDLLGLVGLPAIADGSPLPSNGTWDGYWTTYEADLIDEGYTQASWLEAYEECTDACIAPSLCESAYEVMLVDVTPGGLYGAVDGSSVNSVFASNSNLDANGSTTTEPWRFPTTKFDFNGDGTLDANEYTYLKIDGTPVLVEVAVDPTTPGAYLPSILSGVTPQAGSNGGLFVYPHQLTNVSDFTSIFEEEWARGLVAYHPEYCYYESCLRLKEDHSSGASAYASSEEYDAIMQGFEVLADAVAQYGNAFTQLSNFDDPYFLYGDGVINGLNYSGIYGSTPNVLVWARQQMTDRIANYHPGLSMWDVAKNTTTRCGGWYGSDPCPTMYSTFNSSQYNEAWAVFKSLYLSEKQKIQSRIAQGLAELNGCHNGNIPFENRRFPDIYDVNVSTNISEVENDVDYQTWLQTGQCPNAFDLQLLLNGFANADRLAATNFTLLNIPEFTPSLYQVISERDIANAPYAQYEWDATTSGSTLLVDFNTVGAASFGDRVGSCIQGNRMLTLTLQGNPQFSTSQYNWNNYNVNWRIERFDQLTASSTEEFDVLAYIQIGSNPTLYEVVISGTTCIPMKGCEQISGTNSGFGSNNDPGNANGTNGFNSACPATDLVTEIGTLLNTSIDTRRGNFIEEGVSADDYPALVSAIGGNPGTLAVSTVSSNVFHITGGFYIRFIPPFTLPANLISLSNFNPITDYIIEAEATYTTGSLPFNPLALPSTLATKIVRFELSRDEAFRDLVMVTNCCDDNAGGTITMIPSTSPNDVLSDFESGNTGFGSDLGYTTACISHSNQSSNRYMIFDASNPCQGTPSANLITDHTTGAGKLMLGYTLGNPTILWEKTVPVTANTDYNFSFWLANYETKYSGDLIVVINNQIIKQIDVDASVVNLNQWYPIAEDWNSSNTTNASIQIRYLESTVPGSGNESIFGLDDIVLSPQATVCVECLPNTAAPVDCYSKYEEYIGYVTAQTPFNVNVPNGNVYYPYYYQSQETFCASNAKLNVTPYKAYMNGLVSGGVANPFLPDVTNAFFISFNEFVLQDLGADVQNYLAYLAAIGFSDDVADGFMTLQDFAAGAYSAACVARFASLGGQTALAEACVGLAPRIATCPRFVVPTVPEPIEGPDPCVEYLTNLVASNAQAQYTTYIEEIREDFKQRYIAYAIQNAIENFTVQIVDMEYHYTLYNYDQGGNLVSTVPPRGVKRFDLTASYGANTIGSSIRTARANKAQGQAPALEHNYLTEYTYNTLNQLIEQETPDGGVSRFWYDNLSRLVASQNAEQALHNEYSYTSYDGLGRITEVGQLVSSTAPVADYLGNTVALSDPNFPYNGTWPNVSEYNEVTRTYYDDGLGVILPATLFANGQQNLRNRVARTTYQDEVDMTYPQNTSDYERATHYSYDFHGNVKELVQENRSMQLGHTFKHLAYTYDLVSGNVIQVDYQKGQPDAFSHKYEYDADNRITNALTSENGVIWAQDAKYFYYDHGPLARCEKGDDKVQGEDFAYTIQGWLKGVNGTTINEVTEMGKDGYLNQSNLNANTAKDAYGFNLSYFDNDYDARVNTANSFKNDLEANVAIPNNRSLYNGNIAQMAVALVDQNEEAIPLMANNYAYDQLNRIKAMRAKMTSNGNQTYAQATVTGNYSTDLKYDNNGNILSLQRAKDDGGAMDDLKYYYYTKSGATFDPMAANAAVANPTNATNRLAYVTDGAGKVLTSDLGSQGAGNYTYDAIGNLESDAAENISDIDWTVYGKVWRIQRSDNTNELEFKYDAAGNRVTKVFKPTTDPLTWETTHYVRDAAGNVMATYKHRQEPAAPNVVTPTDVLTLSEHHIYGSKRLGVVNRDLELDQINPESQTFDTNNLGWSSENGGLVTVNANAQHQQQKLRVSAGTNQGARDAFSMTAGKVQVISMDLDFDPTLGALEIGIRPLGGSTFITTKAIAHPGRHSISFTATTTGGAHIVVRSTTIDPHVFYIDNVIFEKLDAPASQLAFDFNKGVRNYELSNHLGNVMEVVTDKKIPITDEIIDYSENFNAYPAVTCNNCNNCSGWTTCNGMFSRIGGTTDRYIVFRGNGAGLAYKTFTTVPGVTYTFNFRVRNVNGPSALHVANGGFATWNSNIVVSQNFSLVSSQSVTFTASSNQTTLVFKVPNGRRAFLDNMELKHVNSRFVANTVSYSDYYPFGSLLNGRHGSSAEYRYGFGGQEKDSEIAGIGNSYTADFWQYDPRLGRRWNVDPMEGKYAWQSPYAVFNNNPSYFNDPLGLEGEECNSETGNEGGNELPTLTIDHGSLQTGINKNTVVKQAEDAAVKYIKSKMDLSGLEIEDSDIDVNAFILDFINVTPIVDVSVVDGVENYTLQEVKITRSGTIPVIEEGKTAIFTDKLKTALVVSGTGMIRNQIIKQSVIRIFGITAKVGKNSAGLLPSLIFFNPIATGMGADNPPNKRYYEALEREKNTNEVRGRLQQELYRIFKPVNYLYPDIPAIQDVLK